MKKLLVLVVVLVGVFSAAVVPVGAVPTADLTKLAAHFPAETAVFAALRTDEGYIDTLDSIIDRINAAFPEPVIEDSLRDSLNEASEEFGGDFETVFRSWLGDTAAIGVDLSYVTDDDPENDYLAALMALEITDSEAAQEAWSNALSMNPDSVGYTVTDENGMTIYTPNTDGPVLDGTIPLAFADDYMLVGNLDIAMGVEQTLDGSEAFTGAMNALPNGDYNIALYMDTAALFEVNMAMMENRGMTAQMGGSMDMLTALGGSSGQGAIGFATDADRTLIIDAVSTADVNTMAEALGIDPALFAATQTPVDTDFAGNIPAGTPIVMHVANLSAFYDYLTGVLPATIASNAEAMGGDAEEAMQEIESALSAVQFMVRGATGLDLEEAILGWMTGDVAIWLGLSPSLEDADNLFAALMQGLPVNFGLVVDATADPEKAAGLVEGLGNALDLAVAQMGENSTSEIEITSESIGGTDATVVTITDRSLPFPIELIIGSNDNVFVLGTRAAAEAAFDPSNSLLDDPAFQEAGAYLLPNPYQVYYLAGGGLLPLTNLLGEEGGSDAEMLGGLLGLVSSSSMSAAQTEDGMTALRLVLSLSE